MNINLETTDSRGHKNKVQFNFYKRGILSYLPANGALSLCLDNEIET